MENYTIVILIMAVMIILSSVADKVRLPYPILLISAGIGLGFIPGMPDVELNPAIVFLIFLPPLLYDAAFKTSYKEFKTHFNTIATLATGLVFLTTAGIAAIAHYIIPGMNWPLSFVLGAILSATDAVAAIGVTKGLGLSRNATVILEGESLVNDASALIAWRFAIAAVTGITFVIWKAWLQFWLLIGGGLVVGVLLGYGLAFVLKRVRDNVLVAISFMLLMPFVTYSVAEDLHVSGVLAVVTFGLVIARFGNKDFPDALKQQSASFWNIIIFLLNGLIFILIGLEFPHVLKKIGKGQALAYAGYALLIFLVALLVRMARVFLQRINLQQAFRRGKRKMVKEALLDVPTSLIISWAGMRGIVSLAAAISLPVMMDNGRPFPQRNEIIFVSVLVVLYTVIIQGLFLPVLVRRLKTSGPTQTSPPA